jgi:hypothetical protein
MTTILWILVLGIPIALVLSYYIIGILRIILERLRPTSKKTRQTTIPLLYERKEITPFDDNEYSELCGYESSAEMDLEDEEED